jgi:hypothetical protein
LGFIDLKLKRQLEGVSGGKPLDFPEQANGVAIGKAGHKINDIPNNAINMLRILLDIPVDVLRQEQGEVGVFPRRTLLGQVYSGL